MPAPTPILIAGPTACGKTSVATALAEAIGGEVVCADAFQVYRAMAVLTAQPTAEERGATPHHLYGEVDPRERWDVARWLARADEVCAAIAGRGRTPVLCGGTGLYLRAFTHGIAALPAADPGIRSELEGKSAAELVALYQSFDPEGAARIDRKNPRRLIRAIEVCRLTGKPFSAFREQGEPSRKCAAFFLVPDRSTLAARIEARTRRMFANGVAEEARALGVIGPTASRAIGFAEARAVAFGAMGVEEAIRAIAQATRQYAKRQLTWFRRQPLFSAMQVPSDPQALVPLIAEAGARA